MKPLKTTSWKGLLVWDAAHPPLKPIIQNLGAELDVKLIDSGAECVRDISVSY